MDRDETKYPWAPYDDQADDKTRIAWLEDRLEYLRREADWHDTWLERLDEQIHEISSTTPVSPAPRRCSPATLSTYWRWTLLMDCMADVPSQMELCLQGLVGAAFDMARLECR